MVNVIGLGYIGLPTALMLASHGVEVVGTDYNESLVDKLQKGDVPFKEQGLEALFTDACKKGIKFSSAYSKTDMYIISVPTPYNKIDKKINVEYVVNAVKQVLEVAVSGATIIIESTISPGTIDKNIRPIIEESHFTLNKDIFLAHAPERIIPGNMLKELLYNNRTIGADSEMIGNKVKDIYASFCKGEIVVTDIRSAEMTKVVENTYRAINIAFANELAKICHYDGMNVHDIIRICNMHPRVNILQPGPGVGGHCISVDPWFLVGDYPTMANLIKEAMMVNCSMPDYVLNRIHEVMEENDIYDISRVGLYGLTYKENVDDCRESPTLQLLESQKRHLGYALKVYDPFVLEDIVDNQYHDFEAFVKDIDLIVVMVGHDEIKAKKDMLLGKIVLDTRNVLKGNNEYSL